MLGSAFRRVLWRVGLPLMLVLGATLGAVRATSGGPFVRSHVRGLVRVWVVHYRAHNGALRAAYVDLPRWYGPRNDPSLPLVISPHGRGATPAANSGLWGNLPAEGRFAVVNPEGQGRKLTLYSWGDSGQIADLARMPAFVREALPWLRIDEKRIYAVGGSMGGQETLLLLARYPKLLAGAVSFDAPTDLAQRYRAFARLHCNASCLRRWKDPVGVEMQELARIEIGGSPRTNPQAYAVRSPITYVRRIAFAGVPLEIWWSRRDQVVLDSADQSGLLYQRLKELNRAAPVREAVGRWQHTTDMNYRTKLPTALLALGLLPLRPLRDEGYRQALAASRGGEARTERSRRGRAVRDPSLSYPWPLKPFDEQHPIRGGFGDPRTVFRLVDPNARKIEGRFSFHNGVDIVGEPGTPVYPVVSGTVTFVRGDRIVIDAGNARRFIYWHLAGSVHAGEHVTAQQTVLGYITRRWRHVHFGESDRGWLTNPLLHLSPYRDRTPPVVGPVLVLAGSGHEISPLSLHGVVWFVAPAYDRPWSAVPGAWAGLPVAPALISWQLTSDTGRVVVPDHVVIDFRHRLPPEYDFWKVYARGSYQNFPLVGLHLFYRTAGSYLFKLTPRGFSTRRLHPGGYVLRVEVQDMGGNTTIRTERIRIGSRRNLRHV